jgi:transcriptional regulator with XRE-family HTH domain
MSQAQLARKLKTSQPAVARIESGRANVRLSTLRDLGKALDATVGIHLVPVELYARVPRWWELAIGQSAPAFPQILMQQNITITINQSVAPEAARLANVPQTPVELKHRAFQAVSALDSGGS